MVHIDEQKLQEGINFKLLDDARKDLGWSYERTGKECNTAEGTVKNVLRGTTENPGSTTLKKLCDVLGVPIEKVLAPQKNEIENNGIKNHDASVIALKEIYELQVASIKETSEMHIANIRAHYEQHHEDLKENYEKRLADKREIIDTIKQELRSYKKFSWICIIVLVSLLIAEVMNPNLGWLRF